MKKKIIFLVLILTLACPQMQATANLVATEAIATVPVVTPEKIEKPADETITDEDWAMVENSFFWAGETKAKMRYASRTESATLTMANDLPAIARMKIEDAWKLERWKDDGGLPTKISLEYYADTETPETFIETANRLQKGERLQDMLITEGRYYGNVIHDSKLFAYSYSKNKNGKMEISCRMTTKNLQNNQSINLSDNVKKQLLNRNLNIKETTATHVIIWGLAPGVLYSDKNAEYFVPSVVAEREEYEFITSGQAYSMAELSNMMLENADALFAEIR